VIYLDTSSLVKLIRIEAQSAALSQRLDDRPESGSLTSALTEVELPRALRSACPEGLPAATSVLTRLDRCGIGQRMRSIAATYLEPGPRSLHAIHLATAQIAASIAPLAALITYDTRVGEAATELGHTSCSAGRRSIARQSPIVFERASIQANCCPRRVLRHRRGGMAWRIPGESQCTPQMARRTADPRSRHAVVMGPITYLSTPERRGPSSAESTASSPPPQRLSL